MKAREGAKAARQRFSPVTGKNKADQPLDVVQIDHTPAAGACILLREISYASTLS